MLFGQVQKFEDIGVFRDPQDRVLFTPIPLVLNPQSTEQLPTAAEELVQGGYRDGFAKATGTGQEEVFSRRSQQVEVAGLVHIFVAVFNDATKILQAER